MPITTQDVKLFKSERIDDTPEGGGRMTGMEVIDNQLNNLFDDTSRLDRVLGRVSLRKAFGAVSTPSRDKLLGAHAIITDPPDDGRVAVTILELNSHDDRRDDARSYVERYLVTARSTVLTMFDSQPAGARSFVAYQDVTDPVPSPGDVLVLSVEQASHPDFGYQQFVRIADVSSQEVFVNPGSNSTRKILYTFGLNAPLEITYPGADLLSSPTLTNRPTRIRQTDLNPDVRYYGVVPLSAQADPGDAIIEVDTILQPVVPASFSESPILDQPLGPERIAIIAAGPAYTESFASLVNGAGGDATITTPRGITPGSLTLTLDAASSANDLTLIDDGGGGSIRTGGGANTANSTATINYATGLITLQGLPTGAGYSAEAAYIPAAAIPDVAHTAGTLIDQPNSGFNYSFILIPKPAPGTVTATYRALGRWYTLEDNGAGQLIGDPATGVGTVNYTTGTVNVTAGYQPDVGSSVLVGWRTAAHYLERTGEADVQIGAIRITAAMAIKPGSLSVTWMHAATTYTVTDDGEGNLTGACVVGGVDYPSGTIQFVPTVYPALLTDLTADYLQQLGESYTPDPQPTPGPTTVTFTIPDAPLEPGTVKLRVAYENSGTVRLIDFTDDGANVLNILYDGMAAAKGTINYTTGAAVIDRSLNL